MSVEKVTDDLAKATVDDAAGDGTASGEAIYTSEIRGSDEAGMKFWCKHPIEIYRFAIQTLQYLTCVHKWSQSQFTPIV